MRSPIFDTDHLPTRSPERFARQNSRMVRVGIGPDLLASKGAMVGYVGQLQFHAEKTGSVAKLAKKIVTSENVSLMRISGQGEVWLAQEAGYTHLLELEDSIEILVKGNFVAEGAAGPGTFTVLADGAEARGDVLSAVNHRARIRDETRHISYGRALVKALIDDDPDNLKTLQQWQDESLRLFAEVARGGERRE